MRPLAVVIMAAGKGTRMKSDAAKVLHEICGKPLIYFPVRLAVQMRAHEIVVVVGHQADAVTAAVRAEFPRARLEFATQKTQEGTAHAVLQARPALAGFAGDVLILSGDVPLLPLETLRAMRRRHAQAHAALTAMGAVLDDATPYGRWVRGADGRLLRVVEQKDASEEEKKIREMNAGVYLADADFLWRALARIDKNNAQREMYLTDAIAKTNELAGVVADYLMTQPQLALGVNSRVDLAETARTIRLALAEEAMSGGVTIVDPQTTYLDVEARVGADTVIEPGVSLLGKTRVGRGCRVGQGARLENVQVGDGAIVGPYVVISDTRVRAGEDLW
jgi:bifunctional UDP-N-acetylglucosamine pyrophosphorylase/glucosamine-1-phosphate N-acetyltransferase